MLNNLTFHTAHTDALYHWYTIEQTHVELLIFRHEPNREVQKLVQPFEK